MRDDMKKLEDYLYYEEKNPDIKIYCGDCLEIMPLLVGVDLVLADPPYEKEAHTAMKRTRATIEGRLDVATIDFEKITEDLRSSVLKVNCNWAVIFCQAEAVKIYQEMFGKSYRRPMIWVKPDSSPQFSGDRPAMGYESIVCAWRGEGKSRWNSGGKRGVYTYLCTSGRASDHPTEKPIKLFKEIINDFSLGGIVLDPFLGSGTTLVACKELKRNGIGIEINPKYCEIAKKRLQNTIVPFL